MKQILAANEITNKAISSTVPQETGAGLAFYIATLWKTAVILGGLAFIIYLVWGGVEYLTSGGDKGKISEAQNKISGAVVGLAILVGSYAITLFIQSVFKINILRPVFPSNI